MSISLIICCLLWFWTEPCLLANHYCVNGEKIVINLGGSYHIDETIIPEIPNEPIEKTGSYRHCSWEITANEAGNYNSQIVLEGVNLETADSTGSSSNKTQVNILLNRSENVTLGMFQVKLLSQSNNISVQINWDPKTQSRSPVNLRILIPVAGLCSRDMLSFNGSCHAISAVPADIMKAVERCIGDVRLASFTSMAHINEFIAANEARKNNIPYISPLNLSEEMRLGMFYTDGAILSVVRTNISFDLKKVDKNLFQISKINGSCGSLRVDASGKAALQFGNCDQQMKALMSFPEVASTSRTPVQTKTLMQKTQQLILNSTEIPKYQQQASTEIYPGARRSGFSLKPCMCVIIWLVFSALLFGLENIHAFITLN